MRLLNYILVGAVVLLAVGILYFVGYGLVQFLLSLGDFNFFSHASKVILCFGAFVASFMFVFYIVFEAIEGADIVTNFYILVIQIPKAIILSYLFLFLYHYLL